MNEGNTLNAFGSNEVKGLIITAILFVVSFYLLISYTSLALWPLIVCAYLILLFFPSLSIGRIFSWVSNVNVSKIAGSNEELKEDIQKKCGGLPRGGMLIEYSERSMIFLAFLIIFFGGSASYDAILGFLSLIVAGRAIFRFSSKGSTDRFCADWYILGTFLSILFGMFLSWFFFRSLLLVTITL